MSQATPYAACTMLKRSPALRGACRSCQFVCILPRFPQHFGLLFRPTLAWAFPFATASGLRRCHRSILAEHSVFGPVWSASSSVWGPNHKRVVRVFTFIGRGTTCCLSPLDCCLLPGVRRWLPIACCLLFAAVHPLARVLWCRRGHTHSAHPTSPMPLCPVNVSRSEGPNDWVRCGAKQAFIYGARLLYTELGMRYTHPHPM